MLNELDDAKLNRKHVKIAILAAMGSFLDAYDMLIIGSALLLIVPQFHPTVFEMGMMGSAAFIGAILGGLIFGPLADRLGRRVIFLMDLVFFVVFAILVSFAQNPVQIIILRLFLGVGIGADWVTSTTLIAETAPKNSRGSLTILMQLFFGIGGLVSVLVSLLLINIAGPMAWRLMFVSGVIPALIVIFLRGDIPETPRWLLLKGKGEDAKRSYEKITGESILEQKEITDMNNVASRLSDAFRPPLLKSTFAVTMLAFLATVMGAVFTIYTPTILHNIGISSKMEILWVTAGLWVVEILGGLAGVLLVDRWGRKPLGIIGALIIAIDFLCVSQIGLQHPGWIIAGIALFDFTLFAGPGATWWAWSAEVFPTSIRASGQGLVTASTRIGGAISTTLFPALISGIGFNKSSFMFAVVALLAGSIVLLGPEMRNKSLEA